VVVRITGDCPLIDPGLIDATAQLVIQRLAPETGGFDFACNRLPPPFTRSFPMGLDVEACTFSALERAWSEADQPFQREHVMPYLYEGTPLAKKDRPLVTENWSLSTGLSPRGFRVAQLHHKPNYGSLRWTVDTPADLALVREIFARLPGRESYDWQAVLRLWMTDPSLADMNADVRHKTLHEVDKRLSANWAGHPEAGSESD
jgi:spore coat polysaccharide biosynthesis protein SpsF